MMESDLAAYLATKTSIVGLVADRIWPNVFMQGGEVPALVYRVVAGRREHTADGPVGLRDTRVQIDMWAKTYSQMKALSEAVRLALDGFHGTMGSTVVQGVMFELEVEEFTNETRLHRMVTDYTIWSEEATQEEGD